MHHCLYCMSISIAITKAYLFIFKSQMSDILLERVGLHKPLPLLHEHALLSDHEDIPLYFQIADVGQSP